MDNKNLIKIVGFAGMLLGGVATLIANWSQEKQMQEMVKEEVQKALTEGEESE